MPDDKGAVPKVIQYAMDAYQRMFDQSTLVPVEGTDSYMCVYVGRLTELITDRDRGMYLSTPYYTRIRGVLLETGCIRQLKRGGGSAPSEWELVKQPTVEALMKASGKYLNLKNNRPGEKFVTQDELDVIKQQIKDLLEQVGNHKKILDVIIKALPEE
jgi:hypothetical protein